MLITFERNVPQKSDASQNDHKSKGYPCKTQAATLNMQKSDKGALSVRLLIGLSKILLSSSTSNLHLCMKP